MKPFNTANLPHIDQTVVVSVSIGGRQEEHVGIVKNVFREREPLIINADVELVTPVACLIKFNITQLTPVTFH